MKKILFIIIIFIFQQDLYSQKEIVGKVEFYESEATKFLLYRKANDNYKKNLNKRKSKINLFQGDSVTEIETDSSGIFKCTISPNDPIKIIVNQRSPIFCRKFEFDSYPVKDTLKLRISDKEFAIRVDSANEPVFQKNIARIKQNWTSKMENLIYY